VIGDPVHLRGLEIRLGPEIRGRRELSGRIRDRRQQGFTFTGGRVVGPGPVHDMSARLELDVASGRFSAASGAMALPAFRGSAATAFESCRDTLPNLAGLQGVAVDGTLVASVRAAIGRERGCYHLTNLVLSMLPVARAAAAGGVAAEAGLTRNLEIAVTELAPGAVRFHGLLYEREDAVRERRARLAFEVQRSEMRLARVSAERAPDLAPAPDLAAALEGAALLAGFSAVAQQRLGAAANATEVLDLALALNAVVTQAFVVVSAEQEGEAPRENRAAGTCYMWRRGGPLEALPSGRLAGPGPAEQT